MGSEGSTTSLIALQQLMKKSQSKAMKDYLQALDTASFMTMSRETVCPKSFDGFSPDTLAEDVHALFGVAGLELFFNAPTLAMPPIPQMEIPDPKERGDKPSDLRPVSGAMESIFHAPLTLLAGYTTERPDEMPFYRQSSHGVWSLQELGMEALQGLFTRTDDKFNSFLNVRFIPRQLQPSFQQILPLDVPIFKAALTVDEGLFWKRLLEHHYPHIYSNPVLERTTYKSVFLQKWFADYLSSLEPGNISYNDVKKNALAVAMWIFELDINGLKPPKFRKMHPPKRKLPVKDWESLNKETCVVVDPYPNKVDIKQVLKCLGNLRKLSICYGFENYGRTPTFCHTRISHEDIESLNEGLAMCRRLISLRLHKSAIYSQDVVSLCRALTMVPIKKLEISSCFVDDSGIFAVAELLKSHKFLEALDLSRNKFSENGIYYLSSALIEKKVAPLRSLNLSFNKLGDIGGLHLSLMLSMNRTLGSLRVAGCMLGPAAGRVLKAALALNTLLLRLDVTGNSVGPEVAEGAAIHPRLERLNVPGAEEACRRHHAFNRSYAVVRTALGSGRRYSLAEVKPSDLGFFPSYSCPKEEGSPSDTDSELTDLAGYDKDPILMRYAGDFKKYDRKGKARESYLNYLEKKADREVNKGIQKLYKKGTPFMKLINAKIDNDETKIISRY